MKLVKALSTLVALAGVAILGLTFTRSVYGQPRPDALWIPDRQWTQELTLLRGRASQLGATGRDLETAEAERLNLRGAVRNRARQERELAHSEDRRGARSVRETSAPDSIDTGSLGGILG